MTRQPAIARAGSVAAALLVAAVGCATDERAGRALAEVAALQREVAALQQAQDASQREVARLDGQVRALEGRAGSAAVARESGMPPGAGKEPGPAQAPGAPSTLAPGPPPTEVRERAREEGPPPPAATPPRVTPGPAAVAPPAASPQASEASSSAPSVAIQAERLFTVASSSFRAGEHGQAVLEWLDFLARFPAHRLAAAAQRGIADAYSEQRDCRQALAEYRKVVDGYPGSDEVPEALLRSGVCQRALGDAAGARRSWERLVRDHPQSAAAGRARPLLADGPAAGTR